MTEKLLQNLLPAVKEIKIGGKEVNYPTILNLCFMDNCGRNIQKTITEHLHKKLPGIKITKNGLPVVFEINKGKIAKGDGEGYSLDLNSDMIHITANGEAGLYYGVITLAQLLEDSCKLYELKINDWPSIKMRMFHFDLKSIPLEFEYIKYMIEELAEHKINSVLLEYEDKFPFKKHPDIQVDSAMTPEQIQELIAFCKSHCVEPIPLVQSYGHLEYILTKEHYKHLREDSMGLNEICGTNPEAKALIFSMMEEVINAHPGLKYFHIGGDEPFRVRFCPECQKIINEQGKGGLYFQHILPVIEFIQKKGIIPIIWDDMLITHPEIAAQLPKPLIINYWNYNAYTDTTDKVLVRGIGILNLDEALKDPDKEKIDIYKKYWQCDKFPEEAKTFPLVKYYQDLGYEVIGAGASRCSAQTTLSIDKRSENMRYFSKRIYEENALGILSTSWAASNSLATPATYWEYFWYSQLASAEYAWTGGQSDKYDFTERFLQNFYGISDKKFTDFMAATEDEKIAELASINEHLANLVPQKRAYNFNLFTNFLKRSAFESQYYNVLKDTLRKVSKYTENAMLKIDLSPYANRGYVDKGNNLGWANEGINDLVEFPTGKNIFGGVPFDIDEPNIDNKAIICMNNVFDNDELPKMIEGIAVNSKCKAINFLHSLSKNGVQPDECVGHYIVKYADDSKCDIEVARGRNITNWWNSPTCNETITVWEGGNRKIAASDVKVGISLFQWENPHPGKEIKSISVLTEEKTSWLILAINAVKYIDESESNTKEWKELKKRLEIINSGFDNAWQEEKTSLSHFLRKELLEFYDLICYQPIKVNMKCAMIS